MKSKNFTHSKPSGKYVSAQTHPTSPLIDKGLATDVTKTFSLLIENKVKLINGSAARNGGSTLINFFLQRGWLLWTHRTRSNVIMIILFCRFVSKLIETQGMKGAVMHLKVCHVLLLQALGGEKFEDLSSLGRRVKRTRGVGLPRVIPAQYRLRVLAGDVTAVRLWSTMFSLYRILDFPGKLKLNTITDPGVDLQPILEQ